MSVLRRATAFADESQKKLSKPFSSCQQRLAFQPKKVLSLLLFSDACPQTRGEKFTRARAQSCLREKESAHQTKSTTSNVVERVLWSNERYVNAQSITRLA